MIIIKIINNYEIIKLNKLYKLLHQRNKPNAIPSFQIRVIFKNLD